MSYPSWPPFPVPVDPNDPLVTPPGAGLGAWWARLLATVAGTWRWLLPMVLVVVGVPAALVNGLTQVLVTRSASTDAPPPDASMDVILDEFVRAFGPVIGIGLLGTFLLIIFTSVVWGAAIWVIARWGAAQPVALGPAFAYGMRRLPRVLGWSLVAGLISAVGLCFCVLPGLYFAFALSVALCVAVFERANPVSRSFRLTHNRFGLALGRILIVVAAYLVPALVLIVIQDLVLTAIGLDAAGSAPGFLVAAVFTLVGAPLYLVAYVGIVLTYAELRAWEAPVSARSLAADLG